MAVWPSNDKALATGTCHFPSFVGSGVSQKQNIYTWIRQEASLALLILIDAEVLTPRETKLSPRSHGHSMSWKMGHLVYGPNFQGQQVLTAQLNLEQSFLKVQALLQLARSLPWEQYFGVVGVLQRRRLGLNLLRAAIHAGHKEFPPQSRAGQGIWPPGPSRHLNRASRPPAREQESDLGAHIVQCSPSVRKH